MPTSSRTPSPLLLYVDDERHNRVVFQYALPPDVRVEIVEDAAAAIKVMEREEVAVVVTDMRMPGMSGDQLLRIVKTRWPATIRMVVTAFSDIDPILHAINEGLVARYIVKPWNKDELVQTLRWAFGAWKLGRESAAVSRRLIETERLATLGSMSGMIVHDLRQPVMSLMVNIEVLQQLAEYAPLLVRALEHVDTPDKEDLAELLGALGQTATDMRNAIDHTSELISGLRTLGKPRASAAAISDPLPIVKQAIATCHEIEAKVQVPITYEGPSALAPVRMPPTELAQVLINLVANAAQAIAASGNPDGKVTVGARTDGDGMLVLEVRDTGPGMAPEVLERIGTPFFTTREAGTGLGVANCQRLVGAAGGRMRIESELGKGTSVTIVLPPAPLAA
ncbi:MAG TPA: hybrid sensor histidine kinase/response regulator [Kofleriaceae bacterium]|jgi:signal transduction histidine kinase|nr:hybrid sensor histidine kinase/response regulator [Kofleriaceae bacterium]